MAFLGEAGLAMWWDMAAAFRADFEDWHAHEHFPERMRLPGFRRGTRWSSATGDEGVFVMYEMDDHGALSSPEYVARLNAPTPWSARLMPQHRHMVRSPCRVLASHGGGIARHAATLRFSASRGREGELQTFLGSIAKAVAARPGLTGAHLLEHRALDVATTTEQKIRGGDRIADSVFVACGYDLSALQRLLDAELAPGRLAEHGAEGVPVGGLYTIAFSATPADFA